MTNQYKKLLDSEYSKMQAEITRIQNEAAENARAIIKGMFEIFFEKNPNVYGVGWCQYTPYFNDGESCDFGVNEINLYLSEESWEDNGPYEGDQGIGDKLDNLRSQAKDWQDYSADPVNWTAKKLESMGEYYRNNSYYKDYYKTPRGSLEDILPEIENIEAMGDFTKVEKDFAALRGTINSISDRDMEMLFGDHVKVLWTKDGVHIEEQSHD